MKDIPIFSTEHGVAGLVLKQIPYNGCAYITIHDSLEPKELLLECCNFCRLAGAGNVYATGHKCLEEFPLHTKILLKCCGRENFGDTDAILVPVQTATLEQFRKIYNDAMKMVANASYMSATEAEEILSIQKGYFVYQRETIIGIGAAGGDRIDAIVAVIPGCGRDVLLALNRVLTGAYAEVEVASTNVRAMRLYDKLGFKTISEISTWYKIN